MRLPTQRKPLESAEALTVSARQPWLAQLHLVAEDPRSAAFDDSISLGRGSLAERSDAHVRGLGKRQATLSPRSS